MTKRQEEVLSFIKQHFVENTFYPSMLEVASHFKVTVSTVQGYYAALEAEGIIQRSKHKARSFFIPELEKELIAHVQLLEDRIEKIEGFLNL